LTLRRIRNTWIPFLLTVVSSFLVMGYHPGLEDDGIYLAAIKSGLNPALFPHPDAAFFRLQLQASLFDNLMVWLVRWSHLEVAWAELLVQIFSIALILWAALGIARRIFASAAAQWAGVTMLGAMLTLPVSGTALFIADQHLHPRNLATGLILMGILRILEEKPWQALPFLLCAFVLHPLMAAMGISLAAFAAWTQRQPHPAWMRSTGNSIAAAALPMGWLFDPPTESWKHALDTRSSLHLYRWEWYEWLGALAPLLLFWMLWRLARRKGETPLSRLALAVFSYGVFHQTLAMLLLGPDFLIRLIPLQPMRYLHLVYVFMALIGGGLIGQFLLQKRLWRWALYLLVFNGGMFAAQRAMFASTPHLELPGMAPGNDWLQAFDWIRRNTPVNAYFALDPKYLDLPGEDYHCFRALAERSQLADGVKDTAVVTQIPELASTWENQLRAQQGFRHFGLAEFEQLKAQYGVDWVLVRLAQSNGLDCAWHNDSLTVCKIP
jgi:hypothetical protein